MSARNRRGVARGVTGRLARSSNMILVAMSLEVTWSSVRRAPGLRTGGGMRGRGEAVHGML